jgi:hypothetical protein
MSVDDAWRLLLAGAITVAQAAYPPNEIAEMLRRLADGVDAGGLGPTERELN